MTTQPGTDHKVERWTNPQFVKQHLKQAPIERQVDGQFCFDCRFNGIPAVVRYTTKCRRRDMMITGSILICPDENNTGSDEDFQVYWNGINRKQFIGVWNELQELRRRADVKERQSLNKEAVKLLDKFTV